MATSATQEKYNYLKNLKDNYGIDPMATAEYDSYVANGGNVDDDLYKLSQDLVKSSSAVTNGQNGTGSGSDGTAGTTSSYWDNISKVTGNSNDSSNLRSDTAQLAAASLGDYTYDPVKKAKVVTDTQGYFGTPGQTYTQSEMASLMRDASGLKTWQYTPAVTDENGKIITKASAGYVDNPTQLGSDAILNNMTDDQLKELWEKYWGGNVLDPEADGLWQSGRASYYDYLNNGGSSSLNTGGNNNGNGSGGTDGTGNNNGDVTGNENNNGNGSGQNNNSNYLDPNDFYTADGLTDGGTYLRNSSGQLCKYDDNGNIVPVSETDPAYIEAKARKGSVVITGNNGSNDNSFETFKAKALNDGYTYDEATGVFTDLDGRKWTYDKTSGRLTKYTNDQSGDTSGLTHYDPTGAVTTGGTNLDIYKYTKQGYKYNESTGTFTDPLTNKAYKLDENGDLREIEIKTAGINPTVIKKSTTGTNNNTSESDNNNTTLTSAQLSEKMKAAGYIQNSSGLWIKDGKVYNAYLNGDEPTVAMSLSDYYKKLGYTVNADGTYSKDGKTYKEENGDLIETTTTEVTDDDENGEIKEESGTSVDSSEFLKWLKELTEQVTLPDLSNNTLLNSITDQLNSGVTSATDYLKEYAKQLLNRASDSSAQSTANLMSALRANRASGLTSSNSLGSILANEYLTGLGLGSDTNSVLSELANTLTDKGYDIAETVKDIPANAISLYNTLFNNTQTSLANIISNLGYQGLAGVLSGEASDYAAYLDYKSNKDNLDYQKEQNEAEAEKAAKYEALIDDPETWLNSSLSDKLGAITYYQLDSLLPESYDIDDIDNLIKSFIKGEITITENSDGSITITDSKNGTSKTISSSYNSRKSSLGRTEI